MNKRLKEQSRQKLSYLHILPPIVIHSALIWRVATVLLTRAASPAARSVELVPHEGFEMSRKSPGTVIEIFRDNLGIEKVSFFSPFDKFNHRINPRITIYKNKMINGWKITKLWESRNEKCTMKFLHSNAVRLSFSCCSNWFRKCNHEMITVFTPTEWFPVGFQIARKVLLSMKVFSRSIDLEATTVSLISTYPKSIFCPRYQTINLKSSEGRSSNTRLA